MKLYTASFVHPFFCSDFVGDGGKFSINNGKVVTKAALDREINDSYTLLINVTDHGQPALSVRKLGFFIEPIIKSINTFSSVFSFSRALHSLRVSQSLASHMTTSQICIPQLKKQILECYFFHLKTFFIKLEFYFSLILVALTSKFLTNDDD